MDVVVAAAAAVAAASSPNPSGFSPGGGVGGGGEREKAAIAAHPLYERLLEAHVACLRVATPVDQHPCIDARIAARPLPFVAQARAAAAGGPSGGEELDPFMDRGRDSDDEDFQDRDYDVAALASNLSQAFKYGIYSNEDIDRAQASLERDDEDVYFDDEYAEVVISSLRLGDEEDMFIPFLSSLFTNSNWFAFDEDKALNDDSVITEASPSPNSEISAPKLDDENDEVILGEVIDDTIGSEPPSVVSSKDINEDFGHTVLANGTIDKLEDDIRPPTPDVEESQHECVEWREEEAEPGLVVEKDTAAPDFQVEDEKQMDSMDIVMPCEAKLGEVEESNNSSGSSALETTIEAVLQVSCDFHSTKHPEPVGETTVSEYPLGGQNEEDENKRE